MKDLEFKVLCNGDFEVAIRGFNAVHFIINFQKRNGVSFQSEREEGGIKIFTFTGLTDERLASLKNDLIPKGFKEVQLSPAT